MLTQPENCNLELKILKRKDRHFRQVQFFFYIIITMENPTTFLLLSSYQKSSWNLNLQKIYMGNLMYLP